MKPQGRQRAAAPQDQGPALAAAILIPWGGERWHRQRQGPEGLSSEKQDDRKRWDLEILQGPGACQLCCGRNQRPASEGSAARPSPDTWARTRASRPLQAGPGTGDTRAAGPGGGRAGINHHPAGVGAGDRASLGARAKGTRFLRPGAARAKRRLQGGGDGWLEGKPGGQQTEAWPWVFAPGVRKGRVH